MNGNDYYKALRKQKEILEEQGYQVAYMALYGSQNYGLELFSDDYQSDIDMKAIIVPTLDDLIHNTKPISNTIETEWGQCDLKDIRTYFEKGLLKGNPSYLETLFTKFFVIDDAFTEEFQYFFSKREELVYCLRAQMIRAMFGMMCEKKKALCHPYPTIKWKIDKYGADFKQSHHIFRLVIMMENYFSKNKSFKECLTVFTTAQKDLLMDMKSSNVELEDIKQRVDVWMSYGELVKNYNLDKIEENKIDYSIRDEFLKLSKEIIKKKIIQEVGNNE